MGFPLIPILLAAGAGIGVTKVYEAYQKTKATASTAQQPAGTVSSLVQNASYAIQAVILPAIGTTNPSVAQANILNWFTQSGFKVLSQPAPQTPADAQAFASGQQSTWLLTGQWTLAQPYITGGSTFIGNASFTPIPVTPAAPGVAPNPTPQHVMLTPAMSGQTIGLHIGDSFDMTQLPANAVGDPSNPSVVSSTGGALVYAVTGVGAVSITWPGGGIAISVT